MENKGYFSLLSSKIHFPTPKLFLFSHLVCLKIFTLLTGNLTENLSLSSEVNKEEHLKSSGVWFPLQLLLFFYVYVRVCVVFCTLPQRQSLSLFWVSTPHRRPRISWLPVCQCRPWLWPAGWCCRCGNVAPPTGPGSQRLGSLWMQKNSCVCKRGEHKNSQTLLLNPAMCTH